MSQSFINNICHMTFASMWWPVSSRQLTSDLCMFLLYTYSLFKLCNAAVIQQWQMTCGLEKFKNNNKQMNTLNEVLCFDTDAIQWGNFKDFLWNISERKMKNPWKTCHPFCWVHRVYGMQNDRLDLTVILAEKNCEKMPCMKRYLQNKWRKMIKEV